MGIFGRLFGAPDPTEVFRMPDNPDDFIGSLSRRKFWRQIDSRVLEGIAENAETAREYLRSASTKPGSTELLKSFAFVSEQYGLVEGNFIGLADSPEQLFGSPLSAFALTLYRLGSALCKQRVLAQDNEQAESAVMMADMAFTSAILCDPLQLQAYAAMAFLYGGDCGTLNKNVALEWCQKYKEAEDRLLDTPDDELSPVQQSAKRLIQDPDRDREVAEEMAKYAPHLLEGMPPTEHEPMRQIIEELEERLLAS